MTIEEAADYYVRRLKEKGVEHPESYKFAFMCGAKCPSTRRHYRNEFIANAVEVLKLRGLK